MSAVLCLDVGSGTQDALYWDPALRLENCPKFVLPAPAARVAARIAALTRLGRAVHLCGTNMGGGFHRAVNAHLAAGLPLSAHPEAALALTDDPAGLESRGCVLSERPPAGHVSVPLADYDSGFWRAFLACAGLEEPGLVLAAAQDHGHHPGRSSRRGRFALWERFLAGSGAKLTDLLYDRPPAELTRLATLQAATGGGPVMDTGPAAALGALFDPAIEERLAREGGLVVNMGNSHVLGLLVFRGRLHGVFEHHTGQLSPENLAAQLALFRRGELAFEAVWSTGGHGCLTLGAPDEAKGFPATYALGPRRADLEGLAAEYPAPGGDMMLAGCFGLLKAWRARRSGTVPA